MLRTKVAGGGNPYLRVGLERRSPTYGWLAFLMLSEMVDALVQGSSWLTPWFSAEVTIQ